MHSSNPYSCLRSVLLSGVTIDQYSSAYRITIESTLSSLSGMPISSIQLQQSQQLQTNRKLLMSAVSQQSLPVYRSLLQASQSPFPTTTINPTISTSSSNSSNSRSTNPKTLLVYAITTDNPPLIAWRIGRPADSVSLNKQQTSTTCNVEICTELRGKGVPVDPSSFVITPPPIATPGFENAVLSSHQGDLTVPVVVGVVCGVLALAVGVLSWAVGGRWYRLLQAKIKPKVFKAQQTASFKAQDGQDRTSSDTHYAGSKSGSFDSFEAAHPAHQVQDSTATTIKQGGRQEQRDCSNTGVVNPKDPWGEIVFVEESTESESDIQSDQDARSCCKFDIEPHSVVKCGLKGLQDTSAAAGSRQVKDTTEHEAKRVFSIPSFSTWMLFWLDGDVASRQVGVKPGQQTGKVYNATGMHQVWVPPEVSPSVSLDD